MLLLVRQQAAVEKADPRVCRDFVDGTLESGRGILVSGCLKGAGVGGANGRIAGGERDGAGCRINRLVARLVRLQQNHRQVVEGDDHFADRAE